MIIKIIIVKKQSGTERQEGGNFFFCNLKWSLLVIAGKIHQIGRDKVKEEMIVTNKTFTKIHLNV